MSEKFKILIVEDEPDQVIPLQNVLMGAGFEVSIAENGQDALTHLNANLDTDLIISDFYMPDFTGGIMIKKMASLDEALLNIPLIFVSANPEKSMINPLPMETPIVGLIRKPYDLKAILSVLKKVWKNDYQDLLDGIKAYRNTRDRDEEMAIATACEGIQF